MKFIIVLNQYMEQKTQQKYTVEGRIPQVKYLFRKGVV